MAIFVGRAVPRTIVGRQTALALRSKNPVAKFLNMTGNEAFNKLTGRERLINELNQVRLRMAAAERDHLLEVKNLQENAAAAVKGLQSEIEKLKKDVLFALAEKNKIESELHYELNKLNGELKAQQRTFIKDKMTALEKLVGQMSHEVSSKLGGIMGATDLIEAIVYKLGVQQETRSMIEILHTSSGKLRDFLQKLKLFHGKIDKIENLDPNLIIMWTAEVLKADLPKTAPFEISLNLSSKSLLRIFNEQFIIMIENLVKNSTDAMAGGGAIRVSTEDIKLKEEIKGTFEDIPKGDYLRLSVSDNGIGIEKEILMKIFDPGFTTAKFGQKEGLGLSAVWGIVHRHNGFIDVKTEVGKGTTFCLYFPVIVLQQ